jgi:hypothetical protein
MTGRSDGGKKNSSIITAPELIPQIPLKRRPALVRRRRFADLEDRYGHCGRAVALNAAADFTSNSVGISKTHRRRRDLDGKLERHNDERLAAIAAN